MDLKTDNNIQLQDFKPSKDHFLSEVLSGLKKRQKELPTKYFYDDRGSSLFQCICILDEYYIPRTEISIMKTYIKEIANLLGENIVFIEYGCGDCTKTRILLNHLSNPATFIPIDISQEQLMRASRDLATDYPELEVVPVCADYTGELSLPISKRPDTRRVVYFPGSSIGNFKPEAARHFIESIARVCSTGGMLLIGVDLKKDPIVLHNAYNDSQGLTAAFNLNLLVRINRELGADFQLEYFGHRAFYNPEQGRVEMHLASSKNQVVHINNVAIPFTEDETIWTESSYKYSIDEFASIANSTGFQVKKAWTDKKQWFSVQCLESTK